MYLIYHESGRYEKMMQLPKSLNKNAWAIRIKSEDVDSYTQIRRSESSIFHLSVNGKEMPIIKVWRKKNGNKD